MPQTAIILLCLSLFCRTTPFEILESTSQSWTAGRKEAGRGVYYSMLVVSRKDSDKLQFEGIKPNNSELLPVKILTTQGDIVESFDAGDTLKLKAARILKKPSSDDRGKCELFYSYKSKKESMSVLFEEKDPLSYP